jgi:hypothetical protein
MEPKFIVRPFVLTGVKEHHVLVLKCAHQNKQGEEKVSYGKRRIMETQLFHHAKII